MIEAGIILVDGSWKNDLVSQGYKFTEYFMDADFAWKTVTCQTILKKNLDEQFEKKIHFLPAVYNRLQKWFDPNRLKIDYERAIEIIDYMEHDEIMWANESIEKIRKAKFHARQNRCKVETFNAGDFHFSQDGFGYRIHSSITQMPKFLRSLITYDGEPLAEIDLSCSQLFFSTFLLDYRHWKTKKFLYYKKYLDNIWYRILVISNSNSIEYSNTIMCLHLLHESFKSIDNQSFTHQSTTTNFLKNCCSGQLYESIVDELDRKKYFPDFMPFKEKRNRVKSLLLDQLFADPNLPEHKKLFCPEIRPIIDSFKALYPDVMLIYEKIKKGQQKDRYKDLCRLFQRIESVAMQGFVCKRMNKEYPFIPLFTLHDCLITTEKNLSVIRQIMNEEIAGYMGYAPTMKAKLWSEYEELIPEELKLRKAA